MAEKLEELSVKDKASEGKEEEDKKETEKKEDEKKEVKAEEKNWEPRTCFADLQFISFSSFSTIDSKWTEFGHLHIISCFFLLSVLPQDHKSLMPLGGKYNVVNLWKKEALPSHPFPSAPWNATLSTLVINNVTFDKLWKEACDGDNSHIGFFFLFSYFDAEFVGREDNVACLLAAQGQGPGIMEVHYTCQIPWCISVGLLTLSTVHASTVINSK